MKSTFDKWMIEIVKYLTLRAYVGIIGTHCSKYRVGIQFFEVMLDWSNSKKYIETCLMGIEISPWRVTITILFLPFVFEYVQPDFPHIENDDEQ